MDQRLQSILEHYESLKIGLDEPFSFHCKQCGKCCIHREDILLNPNDLYRLSKYLGLQPQEIVEQYCETYIGETSRMPVVRLLPRGSVRRCPFLKNQKCSVHAAKPVVCAMYPIGRSILFGQQAAEAPDEAAVPKIQYLLSKTSCKNGSETHTVREVLDSFGIPVEDPFFLAWNQLLLQLRVQVQLLEEAKQDKALQRLWNMILLLMYQNYDTAKAFEPQFKNNREFLLRAASEIGSQEAGAEDE